MFFIFEENFVTTLGDNLLRKFPTHWKIKQKTEMR